LDKKIVAVSGEARGDASSPGLPGGTIDLRNANLTRLNDGFSSLLENLQSADVAPTAATILAAEELQQTSSKLLSDWEAIKTKEIPEINNQLRAANQSPLGP
jgi:hypothetical protein